MTKLVRKRASEGYAVRADEVTSFELATPPHKSDAFAGPRPRIKKRGLAAQVDAASFAEEKEKLLPDWTGVLYWSE